MSNIGHARRRAAVIELMMDGTIRTIPEIIAGASKLIDPEDGDISYSLVEHVCHRGFMTRSGTRNGFALWVPNVPACKSWLEHRRKFLARTDSEKKQRVSPWIYPDAPEIDAWVRLCESREAIRAASGECDEDELGNPIGRQWQPTPRKCQPSRNMETKSMENKPTEALNLKYCRHAIIHLMRDKKPRTADDLAHELNNWSRTQIQDNANAMCLLKPPLLYRSANFPQKTIYCITQEGMDWVPNPPQNFATRNRSAQKAADQQQAGTEKIVTIETETTQATDTAWIDPEREKEENEKQMAGEDRLNPSRMFVDEESPKEKRPETSLRTITSKRLRKTARSMMRCSNLLRAIGGPVIKRHAAELKGAAKTLKLWSENLS